MMTLGQDLQTIAARLGRLGMARVPQTLECPRLNLAWVTGIDGLSHCVPIWLEESDLLGFPAWHIEYSPEQLAWQVAIGYCQPRSICYNLPDYTKYKIRERWR